MGPFDNFVPLVDIYFKDGQIQLLVDILHSNEAFGYCESIDKMIYNLNFLAPKYWKEFEDAKHKSLVDTKIKSMNLIFPFGKYLSFSRLTFAKDEGEMFFLEMGKEKTLLFDDVIEGIEKDYGEETMLVFRERYITEKFEHTKEYVKLIKSNKNLVNSN